MESDIKEKFINIQPRETKEQLYYVIGERVMSDSRQQAGSVGGCLGDQRSDKAWR